MQTPVDARLLDQIQSLHDCASSHHLQERALMLPEQFSHLPNVVSEVPHCKSITTLYRH
jgi:hypothetical protein